MTIRSTTGHPSADQLKLTQRKPDTAENLKKLKQEAEKDGLPSVIAKQGKDLLLLSGAAKTESKIARVSAEEGISKGDKLEVDGAEATVLSTDDGFSEIKAQDVIVAVVDSAFDVDHPAFEGRIVSPYNAVDGSTDVSDKRPHGTHVAGIIAGAEGLHPDAGGVAPQVKIMPIKAAGKSGYTPKAIAEGIRYAVDNGAKVINLSVGGRTEFENIKEAIEYAYQQGVVIVVAAGNNKSRNNLLYPARMEQEVLAIGSVGEDGKRSKFSNRGAQLDIMAPGEDIVSALPGNVFDALSGTSMASPYVAGAAALVVARHPDWTVDQVYEHLKSAASDLGEPGWDKETGFGQLDLFKAVYGENLPSVQKTER